MTIRAKIDLVKFLAISTTSSVYLSFAIANNENYASAYESAYGFSLNKTTSLSTTTATIYAGGSQTIKTGNEVLSISATNDYVISDITIDETQNMNEFLFFVINGVFDLNFDGKTNLILFKQNSENDNLVKSLTFVKLLFGKFNHSIGLKNINIDVTDLPRDFNYVFIPTFNRYYYVDSIELLTANISRLHLKEDVLMSWKDLIKKQKAFITRYENSTESGLVDIRLPLEDRLRTADVPNVIETTTGSLVNCTLNFNNYAGANYPNILVVSQSTQVQTYRGSYIHAPANSGLSDISSRLNQWEFVRFITPQNLFYLALAYRSDDAISSYIQSVLWLPFNPTTPFGLATSSSTAIFVRDKYIDDGGVYRDQSSTGHSPLQSYYPSQDADGECPYLIIKDFTCSFPTGSFIEREPYTNYEIYVPFVGWVKIESSRFMGKRILVYYSMDIQSGISTAYVYNYTDKCVIWSGTCTIGFKIDLTTTNQLENIKQKQSNDLNMVLGLMSSALAIGVGVATENPVALAGGILSAGKTIASNVNSNRMLFERATTSFGTSDGALHLNDSVKLRKSYHATISIDNPTFKHMQGLPYNKYVANMTTLSGYVEVGEIHFDPKNEIIYQDEIVEIVDLLQKGVIF